MKKLTVFLFALMLFVSVITIISCNSQNDTKTVPVSNSISKDSMIKRGQYLVTIMGCDDCHSPKKFGPNGPEPDMDRRLSGHPANMPLANFRQSDLKSWMLFNPTLTAFVGPWGVSYAANLTSDNSGIGTWSELQFIKALREGKYKGMDNTRPLLPPMPWPNFSKASDDDLKAIFSFLKSTKPINNIVPAPIAPATLASAK
ncbi:cytochrome c [Segetibacter aerophilus]|nr:cytochrome c [Segetibacter aerophilus]